jgi:hypothetical protein
MPTTERETTARHRQYLHLQIDGHAPQQSESSGNAPVRNGLFGRLLDALHDSRSQQASRVIHQYRHLIAAPRSVKTGAANIFKQPKGNIKMTTSDDADNRQNGHSTKVLTTKGLTSKGLTSKGLTSKGLTSKGLTWALIAACVIGFGILHIAGGAIINGAVKPPAEMPPVQLHGD